MTSTTSTLTDRILTVLASPEWQAEPPGSRAIAEILHERRRDVIAALGALETEGKITDLGGSPYVARAGWVLASRTTTPDPYDVNSLREPVHGTAQIDVTGTLTFGVRADGIPARVRLRQGTRIARHTTIIGAAGSGKSTLLRAILTAATTAGIDVQVIDPLNLLGATGHPTATGMTDALAALADQHQAVQAHLTGRRPAGPLRLLVIDDLTALTTDPRAAAHLRALADVDAAALAGIALVVAAQPHLGLHHLGPDTHDALSAGNRILLRIATHSAAIAIGANSLPTTIPADLPGVGYLPHTDMPLRAWLP